LLGAQSPEQQKYQHKSSTITLAEESDFIKSQLDQRRYRCIQLPNQLQVLLVSDPQTDIEAGAVHIKSGHIYDPPRIRLGHELAMDNLD
jgi:secreted Zn-dependent insulinase-like peptidase